MFPLFLYFPSETLMAFFSLKNKYFLALYFFQSMTSLGLVAAMTAQHFYRSDFIGFIFGAQKTRNT